MFVGLDVGGTHTDAALAAADGRVLASEKAPTRPGDLARGIAEALRALLRGRDPGAVRRVCVSSTLGLNALLTGRAERAGMLVVPGPGLDPRLFHVAEEHFHILEGALDHRGRLTAPPDARAARRALEAMRKDGIRALGVVCKFSPKNPDPERDLAALAREALGNDAVIALGAQAGGGLNFPRRMHTAWCNAALGRVNREFIAALERTLPELGLSCPLVVLKADAGVFSAAEAALDPAGTMGSGPAASLLGVWALCREDAPPDSLMVDMGGTTTDLALMAAGQPLLAPGGLTAGGRPTLVRSLWTRSIALGGDSSLRLENGLPRVGPDRLGPALSLEPASEGLRPPTLTDALNAAGLCALGDTAVSRRAMEALFRAQGAPCAVQTPGAAPAPAPLSAPHVASAPGQTTLSGPPPVPHAPAAPGEAGPDADPLRGFSLSFARAALARVKEEADALLAEVNSRPVYTIRELLVAEPLSPAGCVFIGGPAAALEPLAAGCWNMPVRVPALAASANAAGAALARPTRTAELYADTALGRMTIPALGIEKSIGPSWSLEAATRELLDALAAVAQNRDAPQIAFAESFLMLDSQGRHGRVIRARAQLAAGLIV